MATDEGLVPRAHPRLVLATLTAVLYVTFLDTTIMAVALEDLQRTLQTSISELQWIVNAYALLFASFMLAFGAIGDRHGRKMTMLVGGGVIVAGSIFGALAPNIPSLIAARAVMGIGAATCEPGTLSVIRQLYPDPKARARALGWWAAIAGLALATGPIIGGVLVGLGGWPAIFWFDAATTVAVLTAVWLYVPESKDPELCRRPDILGFTIGPLALGTIVFAIIIGETSGYTAPLVLALFAIGAVALALFVVIETVVRAPMLEVGYFRRLPFLGSLVVAFATYFGVFSIFFLTALYLQIVVGYTAFRTAALFVPMALGMIVASTFAGKWVALRGPRMVVSLGCLAAGAGVLFTDLSLLSPNVSYAPLAVSVFVAGVGFGIALVPIVSVALSSVPARHSGMAASATTTARSVGTVLGVAVLGSLFSSQLSTYLTQRLTEQGVPEAFHELIKEFILTGGVPPGMEAVIEAAREAFGPEVEAATQAAFDAVRHGVTISLLVAGCVILAAGIVAWLTFSPARMVAAEQEE